jgi:protein-L-isoaspartate(D-aspartate) O-methyltransferase
MKSVALLAIFLVAGVYALEGNQAFPGQETYLNQRKEMVTEQIQARGIKDRRLLQAMLKVQRHIFVPPALEKFAYSDSPLPIGEGQTISQPYIVALMTELLELEGNEKVLEIGTGSGYQAAILAELAEEVYTIEIIESLAQVAAGRLKDLGYENVSVKAGDGYLGWPEEAPFDGIIVTAAAEEVPPPLIEQLAEGGRLVIPLGPQGGFQRLALFKKEGTKIERRFIIPVVFVPMTGLAQERQGQ